MSDAIRRFRSAEGGAATIEAVLWIPLFVLMLIFVIDVAFVFHNQAQAFRIVQDGNRALSVGLIADPAAAATELKAALSRISAHATADVRVDYGIIHTIVTIPVGDMTAVGTLDFLRGYDMSISTQHYMES